MSFNYPGAEFKLNLDILFYLIIIRSHLLLIQWEQLYLIYRELMSLSGMNFQSGTEVFKED